MAVISRDSRVLFVSSHRIGRILTVAAICAMATRVAAGAQGHLTIALFDYAGLPGDVLAPAVKLARQAFADAGIRAEWSVCAAATEGGLDGCAQTLPPPGRYVVVNVMAAMAVPPSAPLPEGDLAGFALIDSARLHAARAFAFYDAVRAFAEKAHRRPSLILGCVLVHEIAHTLGLPHQPQGVMRAGLRPHDMADTVQGLAFTPAEARQLRSAVLRMASSPAPDPQPTLAYYGPNELRP